MDSLDGTSLDAGSSAATLGSNPGFSTDATSTDAQASWGQVMADAGGDASTDDAGWDDTGSPWDNGTPAAASAPSKDGASFQASDQPPQDSASDLQGTTASNDAYATQASQDANAILRGMDDRQAAGPSSKGMQLACLEDACIVEGAAAASLLLRYGPPVAAGIGAAFGLSSQQRTEPPASNGSAAPTPGGNIVESNPGHGTTTPQAGPAASSGQTGPAAVDGSPPAGDTPSVDKAPGATESTQAMPPLPADPNDLLAQGWKETSHPNAAALGHRTFESPETGETIRFDQGRRGAPGFEGQDHYHRLNPNRTGKRDEYLDQNGSPVSRGSDPSHILPRK